MKLLCTVLYVSTIVSFIGATLGEKEGGDLEAATASPVCDIELGDVQGQGNVADRLVLRLLSCVQHDTTILRNDIRAANITEEYRVALKKYCDNLPVITACIANLTSTADRCLNESVVRSFKVVSSDLKTVVGVCCEENGVKVATIVEEIKQHIGNNSEQHTIMEKCFSEAEHRIRDMEENASQISVAYYRMFLFFKVCISEAENGQSVLFDLIGGTVDDVLKKLKCIHPESEAEILCDTFVNRQSN